MSKGCRQGGRQRHGCRQGVWVGMQAGMPGGTGSIANSGYGHGVQAGVQAGFPAPLLLCYCPQVHITAQEPVPSTPLPGLCLKSHPPSPPLSPSLAKGAPSLEAAHK